MSRKYKIGVNENLTSIITYINTSPKIVLMKDLIQFVIDYDMFIEFYMNYNWLSDMISEHNKGVQLKK